MGQKVNPVGLRIGIIRDWESKWYAGKDFGDLLLEDVKIREFLKKKLKDAAVSRIEIERAANRVNVTIHTAKPGMVIGKGGSEVRICARNLRRLTKGKKVHINISEIKHPELDATLVAESIAQQLERRISFRRAMKQAIQRTMRAGAKGHQNIRQRTSRRSGNCPYGRVQRRHGAAAHAARGHRLRYGGSPYDLRPHRRESMDLPRRGASGEERKLPQEGGN